MNEKRGLDDGEIKSMRRGAPRSISPRIDSAAQTIQSGCC